MEKELTIRRMTKEDVEDVAALESACFSRPWTQKDFSESLEKDYYLFYVGYMDGRHVATAGLTITAPEADVTNVAVLRDMRGQGVAYRLLSEMMEDAASLGVSDFTLEVRSGNEAAIALYEKLGFVSEGVRKGFYEDPKEDAVIMWKRG